jgi:hypothetical protein
VGGTGIKEAKTIVSFTRGFGNDFLSDRPMTHDEARAALADIRHVVVSSPSFLQVSAKTSSPHSSAQINAARVIHETTLVNLNDDATPDETFSSVAQPYSEKDEPEMEEEENKVIWSKFSKYPSVVTNGASVDVGRGKALPRAGSVDPKQVTIKLGSLQLHLIKRLHEHNLVRSVKWGTSAVPAWTNDYPVKRRPDETHHHIVSFEGEAFVTRPIVLVSVMPVCDGDPNKCDPLWTDVFVVSLSHISTNEFAVNILRLDSLPNNTWGQQIHIAYVAFEPNDRKAVEHDRKLGGDDSHLTMFS